MARTSGLCLVSIRTSGERGATATEYALLVSVIAVVIAVGVGAFGVALNDYYDALAERVRIVLGP